MSWKLKISTVFFKWKVLPILLMIAILLVVTQPSTKDYEEYLRANGYQLKSNSKYKGEPFWGETRDYIFFSDFCYSDGSKYDKSKYVYHIGILKNFYKYSSETIIKKREYINRSSNR